MNEEIISFEITDHNTIEVVKRIKSNQVWLTDPPQPAPDHIWKNVFGVVDGKIMLIDSIKGKHIPKSTIPEQFIF